MFCVAEDVCEHYEELQSKPKVAMGPHPGEEQPLLEWKDLEQYDNIAKKTLTIGMDNRVYERRGDIVQCLVPSVPTGPEQVYVDNVQWENVPPPEHMAHLFDHFFRRYDREVIMLVGQRLDKSGWLYFVPPQVGTGGRVKWDIRGEAVKEFTDLAVWVGTIHSHPGDGTSPSTVDTSEWADPLCSGIHTILGNDGSYTYHGAIAGKTFPLRSGTLEGVIPTPVRWRQSGGRSLGELLRIPPPPPSPPQYRMPTVETRDVTVKSMFPLRSRAGVPYQTDQEGSGFLPDSYQALSCDRDDLEDLRIVSLGEAVWIMTPLECNVWMNENPYLASNVEIRTLRVHSRGELS